MIGTIIDSIVGAILWIVVVVVGTFLAITIWSLQRVANYSLRKK